MSVSLPSIKATDLLLRKPSAQTWPAAVADALPATLQQEAQQEIRQWPAYAPSPVHTLHDIADAMGVAQVLYKDESQRFGLGSFKALGGAYAVLREVARQLSATSNAPVSLNSLRQGQHKSAAQNITIASATDGNHGRSVAWGARMAGCPCRIYLHSEVSQGREQALLDQGARVVRIDGDYDDSVRECANDAQAHGWTVVSDTAWPGYHSIPMTVMAGYTVMIDELIQQLQQPPTHVIVQAGVGGLAAAMFSALHEHYGDEAMPRCITVESRHAACVLHSLRNDTPGSVPVRVETIMGGLSCGEISPLAWPVLHQCVDAAMAIDDAAVADMMRYLAARTPPVLAGECAVPGLLALSALTQDSTAADHLDLDERARVLVFGCEGATDPAIVVDLLGAELAARVL